MSEPQVLDFLREQFRRMHERFDALEDRIGGLEVRVHVLEEHTAALMTAMAGVNHRIDRLQADVSLIKRRLDLVEA